MLALAGLAIGAALSLSWACSGSQRAMPVTTPTPIASPPKISPTSNPSALATNPPGPTPPAGAKPSIDPIVRALQSRDWGTIQPLLQERPEACITTPRIGLEGPVCPAGIPAGTLVSVFPAAGCHYFMSPEELEGQFSAIMGSPDVPRIYAIYRSSARHPSIDRLPAGDLGIILERGALGGQIFTVSDDKIVSAYFGCGILAREVAALIPANTFLISPPIP